MTKDKTYKTRILKIELIALNVKRFILEKPKGYSFKSGQAAEVSIEKSGWENEKSPFTFACLDNDAYLEIIIKINPEHKGLTGQINLLKEGDYLIIGDPWGKIQYKGPGIFIAGGTGVTPFLSIFRQLKAENKIKGNTLLFSNKTEADIILKDELIKMLGDKVHFVLTQEQKDPYDFGRIDETYLKSKIHDFNQHFYFCGPRLMIEEMQKILKSLGAKTDTLFFKE